MKTHKKSILTKFYIVAAFMTLLLFSIVFRVVDLQYFQGEKYRQISKDLTQKPFTIYANKGNVYAADGNLLATSMSKFTIRMDVMSVDSKLFEKDIKALSDSLLAPETMTSFPSPLKKPAE